MTNDQLLESLQGVIGDARYAMNRAKLAIGGRTMRVGSAYRQLDGIRYLGFLILCFNDLPPRSITFCQGGWQCEIEGNTVRGVAPLPVPVPAYVFKAEFVRAVDGDTYALRLDLGKWPVAKVEVVAQVRLKDWKAPELTSTGGPEAQAYAHQVLSGAESIVVRSYYPSFARNVADVWVDGVDLGEILAAEGHVARQASGV